MKNSKLIKRTIGNNANGNNKIKMLISINLLKKIKILIVYLHEFMKKKTKKSNCRRKLETTDPTCHMEK